MLKAIEQLARENPWLSAVVGELRGLFEQKDRLIFAKEAMYSARRMMSRVAPAHELRDIGDDAGIAPYLRRKQAQGKRDPDAERKP